MTKAALEAEGEREARADIAAVPSSALAVPASLHASLMARLDRLRSSQGGRADRSGNRARVFTRTLAAVARKPEAELQSGA